MIYSKQRAPTLNEVLGQALGESYAGANQLRSNIQSLGQLFKDPALGRSVANMSPNLQQLAVKSLLSRMGNEEIGQLIENIEGTGQPQPQVPQYGQQQSIEGTGQPQPQVPQYGQQQSLADILTSAISQRSPIAGLTAQPTMQSQGQLRQQSGAVNLQPVPGPDPGIEAEPVYSPIDEMNKKIERAKNQRQQYLIALTKNPTNEALKAGVDAKSSELNQFVSERNKLLGEQIADRKEFKKDVRNFETDLQGKVSTANKLNKLIDEAEVFAKKYTNRFGYARGLVTLDSIDRRRDQLINNIVKTALPLEGSIGRGSNMMISLAKGSKAAATMDKQEFIEALQDMRDASNIAINTKKDYDTLKKQGLTEDFHNKLATMSIERAEEERNELFSDLEGEKTAPQEAQPTISGMLRQDTPTIKTPDVRQTGMLRQDTPTIKTPDVRQNGLQQEFSPVDVGKNIIRLGARALESVAGLPGDIAQTAGSLINYGNSLIGGKRSEFLANLPVPTSETLREYITKPIVENFAGKGYLDPQNSAEAAADTAVELAATFLFPWSKAASVSKYAKPLKYLESSMPAKKALATAGIGSLAQFVTDQFNIKGAPQETIKLASMLAMNIAGPKKFKKIAFDLKDKAEASLPKEAKIISKEGSAALNKVNELLKEGALPTKQTWSKKLGNIESGEYLNVKKLWDLSRDLNDAFYESKPSAALRREFLSIKKGLGEAFEKYGKENPSFYVPFKESNELLNAIGKQSKITDRIKNWLPTIGVSAGTSGLLTGAFKPDKAILVAGLGLAGSASVKTLQTLSLLAKSEAARKYFKNSIKAAAADQKKQFSHYARKLDEIITI